MPTRRARPAAQRPRYRAARAFYLFFFIGICFATYSLLSHSFATPQLQPRSLDARSITPPVRTFEDEDDECRLVHNARDQCSWVHEHCPEDEGGFSAYLNLYYCELDHARPMAMIILLAWLGLLFSTIGIAASDFFCIDLSTIASILGMSESMAGVTFLAFGNGSPDVFSTFAAMNTNSGSLAVGELFGAAGFITAVVAGSMALIRPFHVSKKSFVRDVGFFIVAAAFSMVFLWDGRLHFWECAVMVAYYIFYVLFVVVWHWWLGRRRAKREKEAAARGHFLPPGEEEEVVGEPYRDDPDEVSDAYRPSVSRGASWEDWSALEGQTPGADNDDEDDEEEARDRWMSELASNMRLTKPIARSRRNTVTPVRPSLIGALEFQTVLKSLQKSRNIQTIPLNSRRFSDDPTFTTLQQQDNMGSSPNPAIRPSYQVLVTDESTSSHGRAVTDTPIPQATLAGRTRAVSSSDVRGTRTHSGLPRLTPILSEDNLVDIAGDKFSRERSRERSRSSLDIPAPGPGSHQMSPTFRIEPAPATDDPPNDAMRSRASTNPSGSLLAPPGMVPMNRPPSEFFGPPSPVAGAGDSDMALPRSVPRVHDLPKIVIPQRSRSRSSSRATSPFPAYRDYPSPAITISTHSPDTTPPPSLHLPPSMASPESLPVDEDVADEQSRRPTRLTRIWPKILPAPRVIISTLFPTIYHWHDKTWYEKMLAVVAAPSVFLLTITLPVVENEKQPKEITAAVGPTKTASWDSARSKSMGATPTGSASTPEGIVPEHLLDAPNHEELHSIGTEGTTGKGNVATVATHAEQHRRDHGRKAGDRSSIAGEPRAIDTNLLDETDEDEPELWNRWLTIIQLFSAPTLVVLAIYIQAPDGLTPSWLIRPVLISLLISCLLLTPLLLTTTPTYRPGVYRIILSLAGFIVSIAWISAIASQVVGALKALAIILNMSHAIMGLTIFAVGNSLGDLVADVTVAKLGYPVMALSACFGGPMLNILLGVGLSGSYILLQGAERRHHKHPKKGLHFKSYHIEVSKTLIVSGVTLLVTLVVFLIAVPLNRWVLDRKIAWTVIAIWTISVVFNVVIEVTGFLGEAETVMHVGF